MHIILMSCVIFPLKIIKFKFFFKKIWGGQTTSRAKKKKKKKKKKKNKNSLGFLAAPKGQKKNVRVWPWGG
jgi:hypothetical protein